jgi:hypothetical protein
MKKYFLSIAASLLFACSAFAAVPESVAVALDRYDQCQALAQHCDAAVSAQVAGPLLQLPSLDAYRSPLLRSDMRVASAGFVFNGTVDVIASESTAPS